MANMDNPWIEPHIIGETDYHRHLGRRGARAMAEKLVIFEYQGAPDPIDCDCGEKAYYKATIGVLKCTSCGELYHADGEKI